MGFGRATEALLVLLVLLKPAFLGGEGWGVEWNGQLGLVQLGDGGGSSWVVKENLLKA